ncbi:MAG: acetylxylan esterase, partial [Bacteroidota bacterium]
MYLEHKHHALKLNRDTLFGFLFLIALGLIPINTFAQDVQPDRDPPVYGIGENATFTVSGASGALYDLYYDTDVDAQDIQTNQSVSGSTITIPAPGQPGLIIGDLNQGGFPNKDFAAVFDPFAISPYAQEPFSPTFDAFWNGVFATIPSNSYPQINTLQSVSTSVPNVDAYSFDFDGIPAFDGSGTPLRLQGYVMVPTNASGPLPAIIKLPAFNSGRDDLFNQYWNDIATYTPAILILPDVQPIGESAGYAAGTDDFTDREKYHYKFSVAAIRQILDFLDVQSNYNGKVGLWGESQGGGLSLMVAGLDSRVDAVCVSKPALCEHGAILNGKASGFNDYVRIGSTGPNNLNPQIFEAAKYYDAVYAASRINIPTFVEMGYLDIVAPSATAWAAINQLKGNISIAHLFKRDHAGAEDIGFLSETGKMFFREHLQNNIQDIPDENYYYANVGATEVNAQVGVAKNFSGEIYRNG